MRGDTLLRCYGNARLRMCWYVSKSLLVSHGQMLRGQYRSEGIVTYNKDAVNNSLCPYVCVRACTGARGSIICRISGCGLRLRLNLTPSGGLLPAERQINVCVCVKSFAFIIDISQALTRTETTRETFGPPSGWRRCEKRGRLVRRSQTLVDSRGQLLFLVPQYRK